MTYLKTPAQEETRFKVMQLREVNSDLTKREPARELNLSTKGINYSLNTVIDKGLVKMKNFINSKNEFGYVYLLTPTGMAEKAAISPRFLQSKMDEYEVLKIKIEALNREMPEDDKGCLWRVDT